MSTGSLLAVSILKVRERFYSNNINNRKQLTFFTQNRFKGDSLVPVKSSMVSPLHIERLGLAVKFSREFERKVRVKSEFTGSKLSNSRENFSCPLRASHFDEASS